MGVSKVYYAGETLVDLTGDTVNPSVLLQGETAHGADGEPVEGEVKIITTGIVGEIKSYMGTTPPESFLACDGAVYNIADYPYLAQHFLINFGKTNFFGGDGTTTFAVPDLRGEFLRGTGTGIRNTGSGSAVGTHQNATQHAALGGYSTSNDGWVGVLASANSIFPSGNPYADLRGGSSNGIYFGNNKNTTSDYKNKPTWYTARPTNTSVLYCIRYKPAFMADNEGMLELSAEIDSVRKKTVTVSNLLSTEEGHPLDATQGKVLNDKIEKVNNDFLNLIKQKTITGTTDTMGDLPIGLLQSETLVISAKPIRTDNSYYTSFFSISTNCTSGASWSTKITGDGGSNLGSTKVKFVVYYIEI